MPSIPRDSLLDSTLALLADPYGFIAKRCRRFHSDLFEARILFRKTICMSGRPAAELFYDTEHFERSGAAPEPLRATLFGKGAVQGLDGAEHLQRKALFLQILSAQAVERLAERTHRLWREAAAQWPVGRDVRLYDEAQRVLTQAVCQWAGVPLAPNDVALRRDQLVPLFDSAARGPVRHFRARRARHQAERWLCTVIEAVRARRLVPPAGSPLQLVAWHRDAGGNLLAPRVAAVELLNVLRPTVAVSVYIVWAAHALENQRGAREALLRGDDRSLMCFLQEVRRHYPFFPAVVARVKHDFVWNGFRFRKGRRAMLDLHGTNHDPRSWASPEQFRPERFDQAARHRPGPFDFVPQGGANAQAHHRCPGEAVALALMAAAVDVLLHHVDYMLPPQDLRIDAQRLPALPRSGLVISRVAP